MHVVFWENVPHAWRDVTYVTNATSEQIKAGLRLRARVRTQDMHLAEFGTGRIWDNHTGNLW